MSCKLFIVVINIIRVFSYVSLRWSDRFHLFLDSKILKYHCAMFIRCFLEIKFADMRLISLEQVTYVYVCKKAHFMRCFSSQKTAIALLIYRHWRHLVALTWSTRSTVHVAAEANLIPQNLVMYRSRRLASNASITAGSSLCNMAQLHSLCNMAQAHSLCNMAQAHSLCNMAQLHSLCNMA